MLPIPMKFVFLAVYLICLSNAGDSPEEKEVRRSFARYLAESEDKHQVMILIDEEETDQTIKQTDFMTKISRHVPTLLVSQQHLKDSRKNYIKHIGKNPRDTTLFVSLATDDSRAGNFCLDRQRKIIADISNQYTRPKYLIVHFAKNQTRNYKTIMQNHWMNQFLDTTVLEVSENDTSTGKALLEQNRKFFTLYEFNPFSSIYSKQKDWLKSKWFPDKTKNLHKHPVIIKSTSCKPENFGIFKVFAESINSTAQMGLLNDNFICFWITYSHTPGQRKWNIARFNNFGELHVVVPRIGTYEKMDLISWKIVLMILANVLVVIVLRLVFMWIKFDEHSWQILDIFSVILGLDFLNVPKRVIERVVACCLLFGCMIYSGYLHTVLTEVELEVIPEREVNTLQDLAILNLTLYTNVGILAHDYPNKHAIEFNEALRKRTFIYKEGYNHNRCLEDLMNHKNVSCTFPLSFLAAIDRDAKGGHLNKNVTIVEEPLVTTYTCYISRPGEILMGAFNRYLVWIIDSGLMSKWDRYPSVKPAPFSTEIENSDVNTSAVLNLRVLLYVAFGYGLALFVFFVELLFDLSQRKDLKQEILRGLRRIKKALCFMLQKSKGGCIWFLDKLRKCCRPSNLRRGWNLLRRKFRNA